MLVIPVRNLEEFDKFNEGEVRSFTYVKLTYLQTRLNTDLMLLSNPDLLEEMGADKAKLLKEAKNLLQITQMVEIPEPVSEKKRRLF